MDHNLKIIIAIALTAIGIFIGTEWLLRRDRARGERRGGGE